MFSEQAFRTWPRILGGGLLFSTLFTLVVFMADRLIAAPARPVERLLAFGALAFVGYLGAALAGPREAPSAE